MEELSFPPSSSAQTPPPGGAVDQQQQENNNNSGFFNAMPQMHHQYFQQPYPHQHFNHQMHYPQSRFMHHPQHHPFGNVQRGTQFSPRARVGDWMCPNSCGLVFSSKTNCFRCGVLKPPGSEIQASSLQESNGANGGGFSNGEEQRTSGAGGYNNRQYGGETSSNSGSSGFGSNGFGSNNNIGGAGRQYSNGAESAIVQAQMKQSHKPMGTKN